MRRGLEPVRRVRRAVGLGAVNVSAALAGKPAFIGDIAARQFPREMALAPDGAGLLSGNYLSSQLEAVRVPTLP